MDYLKISQIVIAILLIIVILLQNREAGVSGLFGGAGSVYMEKRGIEKSLFRATIILTILFFGVALIPVLL